MLRPQTTLLKAEQKANGVRKSRTCASRRVTDCQRRSESEAAERLKRPVSERHDGGGRFTASAPSEHQRRC